MNANLAPSKLYPAKLSSSPSLSRDVALATLHHSPCPSPRTPVPRVPSLEGRPGTPTSTATSRLHRLSSSPCSASAPDLTVLDPYSLCHLNNASNARYSPSKSRRSPATSPRSYSRVVLSHLLRNWYKLLILLWAAFAAYIIITLATPPQLASPVPHVDFAAPVERRVDITWKRRTEEFKVLKAYQFYGGASCDTMKSWGEAMLERFDLLGDVLFSLSAQLAIAPAPASHGAPSLLRIAVICPVAAPSHRSTHEYPLLPFFENLVVSLLRTGSAGFEYVVYTGFNYGDPLFSDAAMLHSVTQHISTSMAFASLPFTIRFRPVGMPSTITGSFALSILFSLPTMVAYHDGCDYFYLLNDDVVLESKGWSEVLSGHLHRNPFLSNFGIAGGIDVSSPQPFLEFPFFHRLHVEIFSSMGAHPLVFRNWYEDGWISDVYLPWSSKFYDHSVKLRNYVGGHKFEPRYAVMEKQPPQFYKMEVLLARERVRAWLASRPRRLNETAPPTKQATKQMKHAQGVPLPYCSYPDEAYFDYFCVPPNATGSTSGTRAASKPVKAPAAGKKNAAAGSAEAGLQGNAGGG